MKRKKKEFKRPKPKRFALTDRALRKLKTIPVRYRKMYRMALERRSRRFAVRVFCLECNGWSSVDVRRCVSSGCPLYLYRFLLTSTLLKITKPEKMLKTKPSKEATPRKGKKKGKKKRKRNRLRTEE